MAMSWTPSSSYSSSVNTEILELRWVNFTAFDMRLRRTYCKRCWSKKKYSFSGRFLKPVLILIYFITAWFLTSLMISITLVVRLPICWFCSLNTPFLSRLRSSRSWVWHYRSFAEEKIMLRYSLLSVRMLPSSICLEKLMMHLIGLSISCETDAEYIFKFRFLSLMSLYW